MVNQKDEVLDFFTEDALNNVVQLRIPNVPMGNHRVKLLSIELKKARVNEKTKKAGTDRIELGFEFVKSTDPKCMAKTKGTIPFFKDEEYNYGEKDIVRFAQQAIDDATPITGGKAVEIIRSLIGFEADLVATQKTKAGVPLTTKKGEPIIQYIVSAFDVVV